MTRLAGHAGAAQDPQGQASFATIGRRCCGASLCSAQGQPFCQRAAGRSTHECTCWRLLVRRGCTLHGACCSALQLWSARSRRACARLQLRCSTGCQACGGQARSGGRLTLTLTLLTLTLTLPTITLTLTLTLLTLTLTRWDWAELKARIAKHGVRNSLLLAPMPTASTAQEP